MQAQEPGVKFQMAMWPGGLQPDQVQMVKVDRSPRGTPWMCLGCRHWAAAVWSGGGLRSKAIPAAPLIKFISACAGVRSSVDP